MRGRTARVDLGRVQRVVAREDGVPVTIVVSGPVHAGLTVGVWPLSRLARIVAIVAIALVQPSGGSHCHGLSKGFINRLGEGVDAEIGHFRRIRPVARGEKTGENFRLLFQASRL